MAEITKPLDEIIALIKNLQQSSHTERRASLIENSLEKIIDQVNLAKNAIIAHILNKPVSDCPTAETVDNKSKHQGFLRNNMPSVFYESGQKLIIPTGNDSKPDKKTSVSVEKNVKNILKSSNTYATITKINPTNNGNIVFQFDKNDNINDISQKLITELGTNVKLIEPIFPKITVHNLPETIDCKDKEGIRTNIIDSNPYIKNAMNDPRNKIELLFIFSSKGSNHAVLKCSPDIRKLIIENNRRIRIDMSVCAISDRIYIPHCTKCQQRNHTLKNCKMTTFTCSYCGKNHNKDDCPVKNDSDKHICNNCIHSNTPEIKNQAETHNSFSKKCPVYQDLLIQQVKKTNWGGVPPKIT